MLGLGRWRRESLLGGVRDKSEGMFLGFQFGPGFEGWTGLGQQWQWKG